MTCRDCEPTALRLARLQAKHQRFARTTNELLTIQAQELAALRADTAATDEEPT